MRWLVIVTLVCGCSFFEQDNRSGHRGDPLDASIAHCATMVSTGNSCPQPGNACEWGEGVDAGSIQHLCTCQADLQWTCSDHGFTCPAQPPGGECADTDGPCLYGQSTTCSCMQGQWRCNSCPVNFMDPTSTCTPGTTCNYEDWEHGCSCTCDAQGYWDCFNETVGSMCPHHTVLDAGI